MTFRYLFKLCLIGNTNSGKSTLCQSLCFNKYVENIPVTIGCEFYSIILEDVKLQLFDTGGLEQYKTLHKCIENVDGYIMVLDSSSRDLTNTVSKWLNNIPKNIPVFIICTKADTIHQLTVFPRAFYSTITAHPNVKFLLKTTAKDSEHVTIVFHSIITYLLSVNTPLTPSKNTRSKIDITLKGVNSL